MQKLSGLPSPEVAGTTSIAELDVVVAEVIEDL
jgi:hypothetical protein